jgi:hypothetical protein
MLLILADSAWLKRVLGLLLVAMALDRVRSPSHAVQPLGIPR